MWTKLKKLHSYNGWAVVLLLLSGVLLFMPSLRGPLSGVRVPLKWVHIGLGFLLAGVVCAYIPHLKTHWGKIKKKPGKKYNLLATLSLLFIWIASGLILTFERLIPVGIAQISLKIHDIFTWLGLPVIAYHVISRYVWLKAKKGEEAHTDISIGGLTVSRRGLLRYLIGTVLVILIGPRFYRWFKQLVDDGGRSWDEAAKLKETIMSPPPEPAPDSLIPVGGGYQGNFRVYTVSEIPTYTEKDWAFKVDGLVGAPKTFTWGEFVKIPRKVQVSDFHCVTGWSVTKVTYEGIPLSTLLDMAKVQPNGKYVKFYSGDGVYTDSLSLEDSYMDDVMVALLMDGKPIPAAYGGPARLIVPKMYGYKAVKWLVGIELIEKSHLGYWQVRGYDTNAWVKK